MIEFIAAFASDAKQLEQGKFTRFQPHFLTYHCLEEYLGTRECEGQCIANGKYCNTDPDDDLEKGARASANPSRWIRSDTSWAVSRGGRVRRGCSCYIPSAHCAHTSSHPLRWS